MPRPVPLNYADDGSPERIRHLNPCGVTSICSFLLWAACVGVVIAFPDPRVGSPIFWLGLCSTLLLLPLGAMLGVGSFLMLGRERVTSIIGTVLNFGAVAVLFLPVLRR